MAETAEVKDDFDAMFEEAAAAAEKEAAAPVKAEEVKVEEVKTEPVKAEEVKTEPVKTEPVKTEEVKTEPVKVEPVKVEPVKVEPVKVEPVKVEPVKAEPVKVEETVEQKTSREAFEATIKPYEPTVEEKAALVQFAKDFPNEYAAVEARLKSVDHEINARVYTAVQNVLAQVYGDFSPVVEGFTAESAERHFAALRVANPDHDTVVTKIPDWIKTQPAYLQQAMQAAYDGGTTKDVLDLVATYKTANGLVTASVNAKEIKPAPMKAAADADALLPISTKRTNTAPKGQPDVNDFDGAWAELSAATK